jgi:hypothetical protein
MRKRTNTARIFIVFISIMIVLGLLACKNEVLRLLLEDSIYSVSGLRLSVERIDVGLLRPYVRAEGLTLLNPPDFPPGVMFEIPLLYIEYDPAAILKRKIRIKEMDFHLKVLNVVRNERGLVNLDSLNIVKLKKEHPDAEAPFPVAIGKLRLKAGKVTYTDYRYAPPEVNTFDIDIDETYENISDPYALAEIIVSRSLYNTGISQLVGFDIGSLDSGVGFIMSKGRGMMKDAARTTLDTLDTVDSKTGGVIKAPGGIINDLVGQTPQQEKDK